jgi:hypothetical protein
MGHISYIGRILIAAQPDYVCHYMIRNLAMNSVVWKFEIIM